MATATGTGMGMGMGTRTREREGEGRKGKGLSLVSVRFTNLSSFFAVGLNYLRFSFVFRVHCQISDLITPGRVLDLSPARLLDSGCNCAYCAYYFRLFFLTSTPCRTSSISSSFLIRLRCAALRCVALRSRSSHHSRCLAPVLPCSRAHMVIPSSVYQMPSRAPSRPSLDAAPTSRHRHPSSPAPAPAPTPTPTPVTTTPPTKSFTKMLKTSVQGTLRAAGFAGTTGSSTPQPRPTESPSPSPSPAPNEDPDQRTLRPAAAASASASAASNVSADPAGADADADVDVDAANTTDKDKKRDESRTARGLRKLGGGMSFIRTRRTTLTLRTTTSQPQTAVTPQQPSSPPPCTSTPSIPIMSNDTNTDTDPDAHPSMSSPDLLISTTTTADTRTRPHQQQKQQKQHQQQPPPRQQRQQQQQRPRRESQPQPISRPRPLIPASTSTTSLVHGPDTPTRPSSSRNKPQTPTRKPAHSPPPIRIPSASASTSHLPQYSSYGYGLSPTHHRNTSSTSLLSSPYRESIRKASSLLVRELTRPPQGVKPRDWEHVEFRLRTLVRLERIWGKSGAASSSTALPSSSTIGMGGSEDRERRIFCESVRDGYVLCM